MHHPTTELVAAAWLATLPGFTSAMVASNLPKAHETWEATGFLTVTLAGGVPTLDVPVRNPVVQVDAFATKRGSSRPPWDKAARLADVVVNACWDDGNHAIDLDVKTGYERARVLTVHTVREPQRLYGDEQSLAKYSVDLQFHWFEIPA